MEKDAQNELFMAATEGMFENVDGLRKPGYTITSPTDKKYKSACIKKNPQNPYEKCKIVYIFRQQYLRKVNKLLNKVHLYIFRSLYIFHFIKSWLYNNLTYREDEQVSQFQVQHFPSLQKYLYIFRPT